MSGPKLSSRTRRDDQCFLTSPASGFNAKADRCRLNVGSVEAVIVHLMYFDYLIFKQIPLHAVVAIGLILYSTTKL